MVGNGRGQMRTPSLVSLLSSLKSLSHPLNLPFQPPPTLPHVILPPLSRLALPPTPWACQSLWTLYFMFYVKDLFPVGRSDIKFWMKGTLSKLYYAVLFTKLKWCSLILFNIQPICWIPMTSSDKFDSLLIGFVNITQLIQQFGPRQIKLVIRFSKLKRLDI